MRFQQPTVGPDGKSYHDFPSFVAHLAKTGQKVFFDPCHGNNGDDLIIAGAESVLDAAGVVRTNAPDQADVIVINGGGMFVEGFKQGLSKVRQYSEEFPRKVLCIGPQSFSLRSPALREILSRRQSPVVICVREQPSQENLNGLLAGVPLVEYLVDHDLALRIPDHHPILSTPRSADHVLIVERLDGEHHSHASRKNAEPPAWYRTLAMNVLPASVIKTIRRNRQQQKGERLTPYRIWVEQKIGTDFPEYASLPRITRDISSRDLATFDQFVSTIARSAIVFSDRLHVGILAARMGKPTFLSEGSYHKCRGIYERSLSSLPNVTLVPTALFGNRPGQAGTSLRETPDKAA